MKLYVYRLWVIYIINSPPLIFSSQWWYDNSWLLSATVDRPSLKGRLIFDARDSERLKILQVKTAHKNFQFQN